MLKLSTLHILAILHRISFKLNQAESVADLEDYKYGGYGPEVYVSEMAIYLF